MLVVEEDPSDVRNIIYCGYCDYHYKKMVSFIPVTPVTLVVGRVESGTQNNYDEKTVLNETG